MQLNCLGKRVPQVKNFKLNKHGYSNNKGQHKFHKIQQYYLLLIAKECAKCLGHRREKVCLKTAEAKVSVENIYKITKISKTKIVNIYYIITGT